MQIMTGIGKIIASIPNKKCVYDSYLGLLLIAGMNLEELHMGMKKYAQLKF